MYELAPIEIAASGMTLQQIRMGIIASNLANAHSTRSADGTGPYRRRTVLAEATTLSSFKEILASTQSVARAVESADRAGRALAEKNLRGVSVSRIVSDGAVRRIYNPDHPDADAQGYVEYPDISVIEEMTDMISASRNYEANLATIKSTREMIMQLVELLR